MQETDIQLSGAVGTLAKHNVRIKCILCYINI